MNRSVKVQIAKLLSAGITFGLTSCSPQARQPTTLEGNKPAEATASAKDIWISETTGKKYKATIDQDVFRAEWVNISPESAKHGAFIRSECKRQGSKWVGSSTSFVPCTLDSGPHPKIANWCHWQTKFEVDSITPDQIKGRAEAFKKFDCGKCQIIESEMADFTWTLKQ